MLCDLWFFWGVTTSVIFSVNFPQIHFSFFAQVLSWERVPQLDFTFIVGHSQITDEYFYSNSTVGHYSWFRCSADRRDHKISNHYMNKGKFSSTHVPFLSWIHNSQSLYARRSINSIHTWMEVLPIYNTVRCQRVVLTTNWINPPLHT